VVLLQDEQLATALIAEHLAPLDALPQAEQDRLLDTLQAWLDHQRHTPTIARALHVHPQTVRYRIAKLKDLLGEQLETPGGRFELGLALRARRAL
jgi:DNA-binding PucR family transcriptional regulator